MAILEDHGEIAMKMLADESTSVSVIRSEYCVEIDKN